MSILIHLFFILCNLGAFGLWCAYDRSKHVGVGAAGILWLATAWSVLILQSLWPLLALLVGLWVAKFIWGDPGAG